MRSGDPIALIQKYRRKGLLVDSNLLLLFLVGSFDSSLIEKFKRTRASGFTTDDFELLTRIMAQFEKIVTTPHILTEVSNLSTFKGITKMDYFQRFGISILSFDEQTVPSKNFCHKAYFCAFGLKDAAIAHIAKNNYLVLTAEFALSNYLQKSGIDAINFNH